MAEKKADNEKGKEKGAAEGASKEKKPLPKAVIMGAIIGGAIILQSAIFMVVLGNMKAKAQVTEEQLAIEEAKRIESEKAKLPIIDSTKLVYKIEDLIINPMNGGRRLLALSVILEFRSEELAVSAKVKDGQLRDAFIKVLSAKPLDELANVLNRDHLRRELLRAVNESYGEDAAVRLFFANFVIQ